MKIIYWILLFSVLNSCSSTETVNDGPLIIDPDNLPVEQITLAEIADDISYIPLDNTMTIGMTYSFEMTSNNIYISMKDPGLVQYDRQGNFVRVVAKKGRGPGEFQFCFNFAVDEENDRIYIADRKKVLVYNINGAFLKEISTENYFTSVPSNIELIDSKIFLCDYGLSGDFKYQWIFLDTAGNLISKKISSNHSTGSVQYGFSYKFKDNLYYSNILNDTIFSVSPDMKSNAAYMFSKGEYRWPTDYQFTTIKDSFKFFRPIQMFESNNYVFIEYSYIDKAAFLIINKETNKRTWLSKMRKLL